MESLHKFVYQDCKDVIAKIQAMKSICNAEIEKREALHPRSSIREWEPYRESLHKLDNQDGYFKLNTMDLLNCNHDRDMIWAYSENYGSCIIIEAEAKAIEIGLRLFFGARIRQLINLLDLQSFNVWREANFAAEDFGNLGHLVQQTKNFLSGSLSDHYRIQDLKDLLMIEQEEKKELNKKLQDLKRNCS